MSTLPSRPLRRVLLTTASTVTGGLLLLALKPHTTPAVLPVTAGAVPAPTPTGPAGTSGSGGSSGTTAPSPSGGATSGGSSSGTRTVNGDTVQTDFGPVQVQVTLTGAKLTAVKVLQVPQESGRDQEIAGFAVPQLTQEALAAQSAHIDSVSGATYTSEGYVQSLQSALDKAGV
jgi:hypothetical protein